MGPDEILLVANNNNNNNDDDDDDDEAGVLSFVSVFSSDTTIREVAENNVVLKKLFFGSSDKVTVNIDGDDDDDDDDVNGNNNGNTDNIREFILWDCTFHPPKDITSWPKKDFPDLQGFKSKTLHAAGMFPSGILICCSKGIVPNKLLSESNDAYVDVDVQYNNSNNKKNNKNINSVVDDKSMKIKFQDPNLRIGI